MYEQYDPYEIKLAQEIADTLKDQGSLALPLQYVRKYKESHLRETLAKVMAIDERSIRKSRAALYTFLINQSARYGNARH